MTSPSLALPYIQPSQAKGIVTITRRCDCWMCINWLLASYQHIPPSTASDGDRFFYVAAMVRQTGRA